MTETAFDKLAQPLDRARIKTRPAGGSKPALSYLETHDVIRTANSIFGFGAWGHEIVELRPLPGVTVINKDGKTGVHVGYVCIVRLTVEECVATSGVGYGDAVEYREAAPVTAHELAAKEAESDALKRALKNFGDQFGLALYDKQAASSGHVTSGGAPEKKPDTASLEAAVAAMVAEKGGDVAAFRQALETARGESNFADWLAFQNTHWMKQPKPFKAPDSVAASEAAAEATT